MAKFRRLTEKDHDFIGRELKRSRGAGKGDRAPPKRRRVVEGTGRENFRLIRGQSVGVQSGATVLIDNVDVLAGGEDPTNGNPATQVTVQNIFGQSFTDNEAVQAIYNEDLGGTDLTDWEAIKTSSGTETYRAIRGLAVGDILATAGTFSIDNVIPLAGGLDPSGGNPATPVIVQNVQGEAFADNEPITAIYDGAAWEVLLTERYRLIQGNTVASVAAEDVSFSIDTVVPLADGLDPVLGNPATTVLVFKHQSESLQLAEPVVAAWNGSFWDLLTVERRRIVRGQVVGSVSAGAPDFQIDNIDVLGSGVDPRLDPTDAAELLDVANFHGDFYEDDEWITAAFNEAVGGPGIDWEALKKPTNEKFRLIRGLVKGAVTADDVSFPIDNVIPLSNGLDPVSANPATEVTVQNVQKHAFADNTPITAIFDNEDSWEVLLVERYRMIRGQATAAVTSGTATFSIDAIEVLENGLDPRTNPASEVETVTVRNFHTDAYANNEWVTAVFNVVQNEWEALKKSATTVAYYTAQAASAISAGAPDALVSGTATVYQIDAAGADTSLGSKTVWHGYRHAIKGALTVVRLDDDNFLVQGFDILEALALRNGFAEKKALAVGDLASGAVPTDIEWLGEEC